MIARADGVLETALAESPSIGRCLAILFGCILGSLLIGLWGIVHLDDKRRVYGATAIGLSILMFAAGWLVMLSY